VTSDDLLGLAPPLGPGQLARIRHVFSDIVIPQLAARRGMPFDTIGAALSDGIVAAKPN